MYCVHLSLIHKGHIDEEAQIGKSVVPGAILSGAESSSSSIHGRTMNKLQVSLPIK